LTRFARNHAGRNPDCSVLREARFEVGVP
jgi:hypothetical protein